MRTVTKAYLSIREWNSRLMRGQTMTEYALILAAVAVIVFATYQTMGNDIGSLANGINTDLTTSS